MTIDLHSTLDLSTILLTNIFFKMREVGIEPMRINEVAAVTLELGLQKDKEIGKLLEEVKNSDNKSSIGEMIYALQFLHYFKEEKPKEIIHFILNNLNSDGGIGRFIGDRSRIPVCWRVLEALYLHKQSCDENVKKIINWIEKEWTKDMKRGGLSYKCAGILLANSYYPFFSKGFISATLNWLLDDQNESGGWGPRKNSPAGSIPSHTGLALRAISNYEGEMVKEAIEKGINWLAKNKLENGFWQEHPVEKPLMYISLFLNKQLQNGTNFH